MSSWAPHRRWLRSALPPGSTGCFSIWSTAGGEEQVGTVVLAAAAYGVPTVVRAESAARIRLGRILDLGAAGVMLPGWRPPTKSVRRCGTCAIRRRETVAWPRTTVPAAALDPGALDAADTEVLTVVQIESAKAVAQVERIAALDGVDVLFVGPRDLSHDLEYRGTCEHRVI